MMDNLMEVPNNNPGIIFFSIIFIGLLVLLSYHLSKSLYLGKAIKAAFSDRKIPIHFDFSAKSLPVSAENYLNTHFKFYRDLHDTEKEVFASRTVKFIEGKNFVTRQNLQLTNEMKLVIAYTAVKITFGLSDYTFPSFPTIIIYPGEFMSKISHHLSKGETNAAGVIAFSWKDIKFGFDFPNDSLNLGYHEFAHALFIEHFRNSFDDDFNRYYSQWVATVRNGKVMSDIKERAVFRDYAITNEHELFAVSVENFFERTEYFKNELPQLYMLMTKILNQDPLASKVN